MPPTGMYYCEIRPLKLHRHIWMMILWLSLTFTTAFCYIWDFNASLSFFSTSLLVKRNFDSHSLYMRKCHNFYPDAATARDIVNTTYTFCTEKNYNASTTQFKFIIQYLYRSKINQSIKLYLLALFIQVSLVLITLQMTNNLIIRQSRLMHTQNDLK